MPGFINALTTHDRNGSDECFLSMIRQQPNARYAAYDFVAASWLPVFKVPTGKHCDWQYSHDSLHILQQDQVAWQHGTVNQLSKGTLNTILEHPFHTRFCNKVAASGFRVAMTSSATPAAAALA